LCENQVPDAESELQLVESLIRSKDVPVYPFRAIGEERTNLTDKEYMDMVEKELRAAFAEMYFRSCSAAGFSCLLLVMNSMYTGLSGT
jgi:hypothetical protein